MARPMNAVKKPAATAAMIKSTYTIMADLLRSTALKLVTTAVTVSASRSVIIGKEKALIQNTNAANNEPTALPIARNAASSFRLGSASAGKKT